MQNADIELVNDGLRFTWHLQDLPDTMPPEGVRYTWSFAAGAQTFQLQQRRLHHHRRGPGWPRPAGRIDE